MLDRVKLALRLTTDAFDSEVQELIEAGRADLGIAGVIASEADPLHIRALILYCKAEFGSNPDSEKFAKSYELLKTHISIGGGQNGRKNNPDRARRTR